MDEEQKQIIPETEEPYVPRPAWQVWGAQGGRVRFILFVIYQLLTIMRGGR